MREILFRGKRIDNGEWVEGFYHFSKWYLNGNFTGEITHHIRPIGAQDAYRVDPSTVGQFTGLTDKNGKKIFEGDIVRCVYNYSLKEIRGHVVWGNGCFSVQDSISANRPAIDLLYQIEAIGNIHDNPELLEVSGDE